LNGFETRLERKGPSPQGFEPFELPPGIEAITYRSDGMELKAWVAFPKGARAVERVPAVAFLHGGFAFGPDDFKDAGQFMDAGFAVMLPSVRGENGNPGHFELFLGEARDAKAAVEWLAGQDRVDAARVYAFGHSAGGALSALLSLHDVPVRHTGSSGGVYPPGVFDAWKDMVPFSAGDANERQMRLLVGNQRWMKRPHFAYVGEADAQDGPEAARDEGGKESLLTIVSKPGDHFTSLQPAITAYIAVIQQQ
jgi:fermentation-respiration switch protein FrsA (DUF1100 family)